MNNINNLIAKDLQHVWHPCSQMKEFEQYPPFIVEKAQGSYLYTNKGRLIDGISSWWCKSLGHGHPKVIAAINDQLTCFEHVISANSTHPKAAALAEQLSELTKKQHVFFASDGSSAVEIAMKLCIHAMNNRGLTHKKEFIALHNGYHGETLGAMSVSDLGLYNAPYQGFGVSCHFVQPPYVQDMNDPLWDDCQQHWLLIERKLNNIKENVCALILEPIVQGAGGMLCYSRDFLSRIAQWAKANDIYLISDEIMTGIGRCGTWLAAEHAQVEADIICLSKGLTSGSIPFSCVMIDHAIFDLFYADYHQGTSFLHSHTYSGNPLAISAAIATINAIKEEKVLSHVDQLSQSMFEHLKEVAQISGVLTHVRGIGALVAADLVHHDPHTIGNLVYQKALERGALIRPMGNVLYWLPPLNTDLSIISQLAEITLNSIKEAYR